MRDTRSGNSLGKSDAACSVNPSNIGSMPNKIPFGTDPLSTRMLYWPLRSRAARPLTSDKHPLSEVRKTRCHPGNSLFVSRRFVALGSLVVWK